MKSAHAALVLSLALTPLAHAQSDSMKAQAYHAAGVVKSVSTGKGTVTLAHEPVPSLNWPSMTMSFKAKDKKMLEQIRPGAKVEFDFEQHGKDYVITKIK